MENPEVKISKFNESWLQAIPDNEGIERTLYEMFTFVVPNSWYHPKFKKGLWDGKIHLYHKNVHLLYLGLKDKLIEKLTEMKIHFHMDSDLNNLNNGISVNEVEKYLSEMQLSLTPYKHQKDLVKGALLRKRLVGVSPTASGKSFAYYLYLKFLLDQVLDVREKILLVVPTISLVLQMQSDFEEYDKKYGTLKQNIHTIMAGDAKNSPKQIYISTWQSIYDLPIDYFEQFKVLVMDEFHQYGKAKCLIGIAEKCTNAEWRLGATGTIDNWPTHHLVMEGLVGQIYQITKTETLINEKILSPLKIYCYVFKYPLHECQLVIQMMMSQGDKKKAFQKEIEYIYNHRKRNDAVCKLVSMLKQNTLVLFTRIEHGKYLFNKISKMTVGTNKVFYIDGSTKAEEREDIRAQFERDSCCIAVASVQVFGVGINIKNLHNVVSAAGSKSKIRVLQKIGRGLRIHESKNRLTVIDIIDDLSFIYVDENTNRKKHKKNFSLAHHEARLKYYEKEKFPFEEKIIKMEG